MINTETYHCSVCREQEAVLCADLNGNCVSHPLLPRLKGHYKREVQKICKTQSWWTPEEKQLAGHDSGMAYMKLVGVAASHDLFKINSAKIPARMGVEASPN